MQLPDVNLERISDPFLRDEWVVPATNTTILAPLPPGYRGGFSPSIQTLIPAPGHDTSNVSQPALRHFLRTLGVSIGAGTVARRLADSTGRWTEEAAAIHQAGLASRPWVATDQTSTRVDGQNEVCHVVGNALFTSYHTRLGGTRQDVLAVLWGQELRFRLNDEAVGVPAPLCARLLLALPWEGDLTSTELSEQLRAAGIMPGRQQLQQVGDALAVAAYHAQTSVPIVDWLLSDAAQPVGCIQRLWRGYG
jgi:hypothetical protein